MSVDALDAAQLAVLRAALEPLDWPARFDRLAIEEKGASVARRAQIEALRSELADEALDWFRPQWGTVPLKDAVLRLESKRLRGALGRAVKRARDRCVADYVASARAGGDPFADGPVGIGMDERVVEMPLALEAARLHEPGEVLDAGSALNLALVHAIVGRPQARVTHFTLPGSEEPSVPPDTDRYQQSFGDLRAMPFADGSFQRVVCVSTLEHVGLDTTRFGAAGGRAPDTATAAVAELARVLAPGGTLLVTVPYGQAADHGWFRIFDRDGLAWLLSPLAGLETRTRYFFYQGGWAEGTATPPAALMPPPYMADVITGVAIVEGRKAAA